MTATGQWTGVPLSGDQKDAVNNILAFDEPGNAIILTGAAGTGKSTVVEYLTEVYPDLFDVTATTGVAALRVGGRTVDAMFNFSRATWEVRNPSFLARIMDSSAKYIIIDEASMIGMRMGNLLHEIAKAFNKILILVGDWAQAAPVKDEPAHQSSLFDDIRIIRLTTNHRQHDHTYLDALNKIRLGQVSYSVEEVFQPCVGVPLNSQCVRMFATNKATDSFNLQELKAHSEKTGNPYINITASFKDVRSDRLRKQYPASESEIESKLKRSPFAHREPFACGCRVIITRNARYDIQTAKFPFVNGDTGVLVDMVFQNTKGKCQEFSVLSQTFKEIPGEWELHSVRVKLDRDGVVVSVRDTDQIELDSLKKPKYSFEGFPVRLGYAATVHKTQGMTLNNVVLDMSSLHEMPMDSRHGLAYVGLSRTRTLVGLHLETWDSGVIYCSDDVKPFL